MEVQGKIKVRGKKIYYDAEIAEGLYSVITNKYIKRNVKEFNIEYNLPSDKNRIGVRYTKRGSVILITCVHDHGDKKTKYQYLIKSNCKKEDILNYWSVNSDVGKIVLDGFDILNTEKSGELLNLTEKIKEDNRFENEFKGDVKITDCFSQSFIFMKTENCNKQEVELLKNLKCKKWEVIYMEKSDLSLDEFVVYFEFVNDIGGLILDVFGKENILIHQQGNTKIIVLNKKGTKKQHQTIVKRLKKIDLKKYLVNRV
tara:strand:- start:68 stop:838 length:771 start_codon:yes stop_codon:yes gene_type:complete